MIDIHTVRLTVNLDTIVQNYHALKKRIDPAHAMCIVKADAYGLGAIEVTKALMEAGAKDFFVAMLSEGIELREKLGNDFNLYVLDGFFPDTLEILEKHNIRPVINTLDQIQQLHAHANKLGKTYPVIIHVDTGMARLGLQKEDLLTLQKEPHWLEGLDVQYIMSHLSCGGLKNHPFNQMQVDLLNEVKEIWPHYKLSLLASEGIVIQNLPKHDACRLGFSLYTPHLKDLPDIQTAITLESRVVQINDVPAGTSVGYNSTFVTERPTKIATISVGYADGYMSIFSNNAHVFCKGYFAPVLGRVSMDLTTIDITDLPADALKVGDWVEVVGQNCSLLDLPCSPYEFLTRLSHRAERCYIGSRLTHSNNAA